MGESRENDWREPVGLMAIHPTTTPLIEVAGDGKTAKAVWINTGIVASVDKETGKPSCTWEWDRYGIDFIKEDGKWKFWHWHLYGLFRLVGTISGQSSLLRRRLRGAFQMI